MRAFADRSARWPREQPSSFLQLLESAFAFVRFFVEVLAEARALERDAHRRLPFIDW
jgi:hypothetical protein